VSRALVLSGGGPVGVGFHAGLVAGLTDAGIDLAQADLIVGTSAGAMVGSQLALGRGTQAHLDRLRELPVGADRTEIEQRMSGFMQTMTAVAEVPPDERLARLGRLSLEADTGTEAEFLERFAYIDGAGWPPRFVCTAIECTAGTFVTWDETSGVDLVSAVGSSCAVPGFFPPVTIGGMRYYDGGLRSLTNADLAVGHDRVLIVTLVDLPAESPDARAQRMRAVLDRELAAIRDAGGTVEVVAPDAGTREIIGIHLMDPTHAHEAGDAGRSQAEREADRVRKLWEEED
jgi:NTE family protein